MIEAYKRFFRNYTNFNGRSTVSDYWYVVLCNFLIGFIVGFVCGLLQLDTNTVTLITGIYELAILVPSIALVVRRLHDINKSGWYYLMILIPLAGPIICLVYLCTGSVVENNPYGPRAE